MTLSNYQFKFNGFQFGAGTVYPVMAIDGLASLPPLRTQDSNRGYIDGSYSGRDFLDARTITFDILTLGDVSNSAQYYYAAMQSAFLPQQLGYPSSLNLLQFQLTSDTGNMRMYGRVRGNTTVIDPEFTYGYIQSQIQIYCPDPRYYNETATTQTGASSLVSNVGGTATTCPTITIASPTSSFTITSSNGDTMSFANVNTSYSVVVDLLQRTVTQNGVNARSILLGGSAWMSIPGGTAQTWTIDHSLSMSIVSRIAFV